VSALTQIHAEARNDFGVTSTLLVYVHDRTGELVIVEKFNGHGGPFDCTGRTVMSAAGVQKIVDHFRPPPEAETHGNPNLDATIEARLAEIRHGVG
jgi:hypothetical protein